MIYSTLRDQNRSFCCQVNGNIMLSKFFLWNEAVEVVEATAVIEAVEVIEAPEAPDAREITQYAKCKLSFSVKRHKQAKNVGEKKMKVSLHYVHSNSLLHIFFCTHSGLRLWRTGMLLSTKCKGHKSKFRISWMYRYRFYDLKVHFWWPNKRFIWCRSSLNTL